MQITAEDDDELDAHLSRAQAPLVAELRKAGYRIQSLWERGGAAPDGKATEILVRHLQNPDYPFQIRWVVADILDRPHAERFLPVFIELFVADEDTTGFKAKSAIGALIGRLTSEDNLDAAIRLVKETRHGEARNGILYGLNRLRDPKAQATVVSLQKDPDLGAEARVMVKKKKAAKAKKAGKGKKK